MTCLRQSGSRLKQNGFGNSEKRDSALIGNPSHAEESLARQSRKMSGIPDAHTRSLASWLSTTPDTMHDDAAGRRTSHKGEYSQ
jgi:hypothetical protein